MNYNQLAKKIYAQNVAVGWWDDPDRCIHTTIMLIVTEITEATEGERKDLMDDHLPHRKMGEVELADAMIRTLDLGGRFDWRFLESCDVARNWMVEGESAPAMHMRICRAITELHHNYEDHILGFIGPPHECYSVVLECIRYTSDALGYDIESAMREKLEYNKTRADHKRENRAAVGGKRF